MNLNKPSMLFVTDLYYQAKDRIYYEEDLFLTKELRNHFEIAICHPLDTQKFESEADLIMVRNTGPVIYYKQEYLQFRERLVKGGKKVFNSLDGKADMLGKQYILDLYNKGYPVISTIDKLEDFSQLTENSEYVYKSKDGADSVGMSYVDESEIQKLEFKNSILQNKIDFEYEVSFYFIGNEYQYSMFAPDKTRRWELKLYNATEEDLNFTNKFIEWNSMSYGIQRVDACRTKEGELLLVEVEDLNPYLSLLYAGEQKRRSFLDALTLSLLKLSSS